MAWNVALLIAQVVVVAASWGLDYYLKKLEADKAKRRLNRRRASEQEFKTITASPGKPAPVLFGSMRLTGLNVIGAERKQSKEFFATDPGGARWDYLYMLHFAVCHGPATLWEIQLGEKVIYEGWRDTESPEPIDLVHQGGEDGKDAIQARTWDWYQGTIHWQPGNYRQVLPPGVRTAYETATFHESAGSVKNKWTIPKGEPSNAKIDLTDKAAAESFPGNNRGIATICFDGHKPGNFWNNKTRAKVGLFWRKDPLATADISTNRRIVHDYGLEYNGMAWGAGTSGTIEMPGFLWGQRGSLPEVKLGVTRIYSDWSQDLLFINPDLARRYGKNYSGSKTNTSPKNKFVGIVIDNFNSSNIEEAVEAALVHLAQAQVGVDNLRCKVWIPRDNGYAELTLSLNGRVNTDQSAWIRGRLAQAIRGGSRHNANPDIDDIGVTLNTELFNVVPDEDATGGNTYDKWKIIFITDSSSGAFANVLNDPNIQSMLLSSPPYNAFDTAGIYGAYFQTHEGIERSAQVSVSMLTTNAARTGGLVDNSKEHDGLLISQENPYQVTGLVRDVLDNSPTADMNPALIIYSCLTDDVWGAGILPENIDFTSFRSAAQTLYDEEFGLSMLWTRDEPVSEFITDVLEHIDAALRFNITTGKFELKLIRADYMLNTLSTYDGSNSKITNSSIAMPTERVSEITVTWTNPANEESESYTLHDQGAVLASNGQVVSETRDFFGIRRLDLAKKVCARELTVASAVLSACELEVDRSLLNDQVADVIIVNSPDEGFDNTVMRILNINYGASNSTVAQVSVIEDVWAGTHPVV